MRRVPQVSKLLSAWVLKCPSTASLPKCLSALVPKSLKCPSVLQVSDFLKRSSAQVPKCLECPSPKVPSECPSAQYCSSAIGVNLKFSWSALWMPNFSLSAFQVTKVCNITINGYVNNFIEILKAFHNTYFTKHLLSSPSLEKKMCKFYHVLLARCNHLKGFQKISLKGTWDQSNNFSLKWSFLIIEQN